MKSGDVGGGVARACDTRRVDTADQQSRGFAGWEAVSPDQLDNVRRRIDCWNRGDFEAWIEGFATDCEWYPTTVGAVEGGSTAIHGHEGLREWTRQATEVWELLHVEHHDALRRGNLSLVLGRVRTRGRVSGVETETPMFLAIRPGRGGQDSLGQVLPRPR
jgi:ketosteroid isomerase-like protein